jgi:uncharacterized protein (TIGR00251 family)
VIVLQLHKGQCILPLKVTPKGGRDCVLPFSPGDTAIRLKVSSPPEDGKANAAVIALMASILNVPKSRLSIIQGDKARQKRMAIADVSSHEADELAVRLAEAMHAMPEAALSVQAR